MIELDAVIGTLIGVVTGATPFVVRAFWMECRERRIERDRQSERELRERQSARNHEERMLTLNNLRETIQHGLSKGYFVTVVEGTATYEPPHADNP